MNKFDQLLAANKFVFVVFAIIALPFVLIWSLIYGFIVGLIGGAVDCVENTRSVVKRVRWEALKYSKWSGLEYQKSLGNIPASASEKEFLEKALQEGRVKSPGISGQVFSQYVLGVCFFPFLLIWGAVTGPIRAFLLFLDWCGKIWAGRPVKRGK